jgi:hypothetical protein
MVKTQATESTISRHFQRLTELTVEAEGDQFSTQPKSSLWTGAKTTVAEVGALKSEVQRILSLIKKETNTEGTFMNKMSAAVSDIRTNELKIEDAVKDFVQAFDDQNYINALNAISQTAEAVAVGAIAAADAANAVKDEWDDIASSVPGGGLVAAAVDIFINGAEVAADVGAEIADLAAAAANLVNVIEQVKNYIEDTLSVFKSSGFFTDLGVDVNALDFVKSSMKALILKVNSEMSRTADESLKATKADRIPPPHAVIYGRSLLPSGIFPIKDKYVPKEVLWRLLKNYDLAPLHGIILLVFPSPTPKIMSKAYCVSVGDGDTIRDLFKRIFKDGWFRPNLNFVKELPPMFYAEEWENIDYTDPKNPTIGTVRDVRTGNVLSRTEIDLNNGVTILKKNLTFCASADQLSGYLSARAKYLWTNPPGEHYKLFAGIAGGKNCQSRLNEVYNAARRCGGDTSHHAVVPTADGGLVRRYRVDVHAEFDRMYKRITDITDAPPPQYNVAPFVPTAGGAIPAHLAGNGPLTGDPIPANNINTELALLHADLATEAAAMLPALAAFKASTPRYIDGHTVEIPSSQVTQLLEQTASKPIRPGSHSFV